MQQASPSHTKFDETMQLVFDGRMLKCDFHMHSSDDPRDVLDYDTYELVDHAARLKYEVLSLTLHGRLYCPEDLQEYARSKGILLIPGIEIYLERREVLLLGCSSKDLAGLKTFHDLIELKKAHAGELLVIAPHPFYGCGKCIGNRLETHAKAFDAIEFCHFYTSWWNPNRRAEEVARRIGKPMIACSDAHQLKWMGHHYNLVDAKPAKKDVFTAIREGRIQNVSRPLSNREIIQKTFWHVAIHDTCKLACGLGLMQRPLEKRKGAFNETAPSATPHQ